MPFSQKYIRFILLEKQTKGMYKTLMYLQVIDSDGIQIGYTQKQFSLFCGCLYVVSIPQMSKLKQHAFSVYIFLLRFLLTQHKTNILHCKYLSKCFLNIKVIAVIYITVYQRYPVSFSKKQLQSLTFPNSPDTFFNLI